jgi:hypothetical protein
VSARVCVCNCVTVCKSVYVHANARVSGSSNDMSQ